MALQELTNRVRKEKEGTKAISTNEDTNTLMELQNFEKVSGLTETMIPDVPGLYAIRIKVKENPYKMQELSALREECLNIAKEI